MPWLTLIPRNATHGDITSQGIGLLRPLARQPWLVLTDASQDAAHRRGADVAQLRQGLGRHRELTMLLQQLSHPHQVGREALRRDVVPTLRDHA